MASGSLFFTKSAILPIFDTILILQREGKKKSVLQIYHPYQKNIIIVASYPGLYLFGKKIRKMASGLLFFIKSALGGDP